MFPHIDIPPIDLGFLELQPFGILLAAGVLFGSYMGRRFLDKHNMDEDTSRWYVFRVVVIAFLLAHIINAVLYEPDRLAKDPLLFIKVWDGISSYGGIMGGLATFLLMVWRVPRETFNRERWMDMSVYALTPGFWFGRMGCSVVHDHIGSATDFALGVNFPAGKHQLAIAGGVHHDLGLYEALFLMPAIWITILIIGRISRRRDGLISAVAGVMYSVPRFFLEYLRPETSDPTYFGFTAAHYFSIIMFTASVGLLIKLYAKKNYTRANEGDGGYLPVAKRAGKPAARGKDDEPAPEKPPMAKAKNRPAKKKKKKPKK